jgi:hypothetical protein
VLLLEPELERRVLLASVLPVLLVLALALLGLLA